MAGRASRYDIVYGGSVYAPTCHIAPHFCRDWDDEGGCYGTREDHGCSWEEARKIVAEWHRERAAEWDAMDEGSYFGAPQTVSGDPHA